ncbi:MAG: TIGR03862 family flavoprotein, partial [Limnohabitans sp.]
GRGGLNLTHSEGRPAFDARYGLQQAWVSGWLDGLDGERVRAWADALGADTFVGSSGRVFPHEMKAAPLLRAWLHRLRHPAAGQPVRFHMRHRWLGWDDQALLFHHEGVTARVQARATLLALGGAIWPRLGSDGSWMPLLQARGVPLAPLQPAKCGFDVWGREGQGWTPHFAERHAGQPLKSVVLQTQPVAGQDAWRRKGEFVVTASGLEGSLIYAASASLREQINATGQAWLQLDLLPDLGLPQGLEEVARPRGSRSLASHLKGRLGLQGVKAGLLHELLPREDWTQPQRLANAIKGLPVRLKAPRPIAEAISTAGGLRREALSPDLMLQACPGVYCAGEMLDWEAPTGGYLLTACLASGWRAAQGILGQETQI